MANDDSRQSLDSARLCDEVFGIVVIEPALRRVLCFGNYHWVDKRAGLCAAPMPMWPLVVQRQHSMAVCADDLPEALRALREPIEYGERDVSASFEPPATFDAKHCIGRVGDRSSLADGDCMRNHSDASIYSGYLLHPRLLLQLLEKVAHDDMYRSMLCGDGDWLCEFADRLFTAIEEQRQREAFLFFLLFQLLPQRVAARLHDASRVRKTWSSLLPRRMAEAPHGVARVTTLVGWLQHQGYRFVRTGSRAQWLSRDAIRFEAARHRLIVDDCRSYDWRRTFECVGCRVAPSTLAGAGLGLFATIDVPARCVIDMYIGECKSVRNDNNIDEAEDAAMLTTATRHEPVENEYTMVMDTVYDQPELDQTLVEMDACSLRFATLARFINYANRLDEVNVLFDNVGNLITIKPLRVGDELLTTYGELGDYFCPCKRDQVCSLSGTDAHRSKQRQATMRLDMQTVAWDVQNDCVGDLMRLLTRSEAQQILADSARRVQMLESGLRRDKVPALCYDADDTIDFVFRDQGTLRASFSSNRWQSGAVETVQ